MKVKFIQSPKIPNDKVNEWKGYVKDSVHDLNNDEVERWLRRGMVEIVSEENLENEGDKVEEEVKEIKEEKIEEEIEEEVKKEDENPSFEPYKLEN